MPLKLLMGGIAFLLATQHYRKPINFTEKAVFETPRLISNIKRTLRTTIFWTVMLKVAGLSKIGLLPLWMKFQLCNSITVVLKWPNGSTLATMMQSVKALAAMLEV